MIPAVTSPVALDILLVPNVQTQPIVYGAIQAISVLMATFGDLLITSSLVATIGDGSNVPVLVSFPFSQNSTSLSCSFQQMVELYFG